MGSGATRTSQTVFQRRQHQKFKPCSKNPHVILALQKSGRFLPPFHSAVKDETLNKAAEILAARNKNLAEEIEAFKQSYLKTSREKTLENHIGDCLQKIVIRHALMQRAEQEILKPFIPDTIPNASGDTAPPR